MVVNPRNNVTVQLYNYAVLWLGLNPDQMLMTYIHQQQFKSFINRNINDQYWQHIVCDTSKKRIFRRILSVKEKNQHMAEVSDAFKPLESTLNFVNELFIVPCKNYHTLLTKGFIAVLVSLFIPPYMKCIHYTLTLTYRIRTGFSCTSNVRQ